MKHLASLLLLGLVLSLAACGFRLRGDVDLPPAMHSTYIAYPGSDADLVRTVARALILSGAEVARSPEQASAILQLAGTGVQRRVVARDMRGRPSEYELTARFRFSVLAPEGSVIIPPQEVTQEGSVVLDPTAPLASAAEVRNAVNALSEDAAWEMLRQIAVTAEQQAQPLPHANGDAGTETESGT